MKFLVNFYAIFLRYWPMKLASVLTATLLWVYVQSLQIAMLTVSIPVDYKNKPNDLLYEKNPPRFISVELKGKEETLQFNSRRITAWVNLSSAIKGENSYPLIFDKEQLPVGLEVSSVPKTVKVSLLQLTDRSVKVKPKFSNELPRNYRVGKVMVIPQRIKIRLPEKETEAITEIETEAIDLSKREQTFVVRVPLAVNEKIVKEYSPSTVEVRVIIFQEDSEDKKIIDVPITIKNLDENLSASLSDPLVHILIQGNTDDVEKFKAKNFQATIDLRSASYNSKKKRIIPSAVNPSVPVDVKILTADSSISIADIEPAIIQVRFSAKLQKEDSSLQDEQK